MDFYNLKKNIVRLETTEQVFVIVNLPQLSWVNFCDTTEVKYFLLRTEWRAGERRQGWKLFWEKAGMEGA